MAFASLPSASTTADTPDPSTPTKNNINAKTTTAATTATATATATPMSSRMMLGAIGMISTIVLIQTYYYGTTSSYFGTTSNEMSRNTTTTAMMIRVESSSKTTTSPKLSISALSPTLSPSSSSINDNSSWVDRIEFYRTRLADVSHELKNRSIKKSDNNNTNNDDDDMMVDISIMYDTVADAVRNVGVRGLLFEVMSKSYVNKNHCDKKHGIGCSEWDVWWSYHYSGAIITDMLLQDHEILWDGSSGEMVITNTDTSTDIDIDGISSIVVVDDEDDSNSNNDDDVGMATLLDKIHHEQATSLHIGTASFHVQHALIWRYVEKTNERVLSSSSSSLVYPFQLALKFCRGDGSRRKGITVHPAGKGIDHECFHGFGHAIFYVMASRQQQQLQNEKQQEQQQQQHGEEKLQEQQEKPYLIVRPHSGFSLTPQSYCDVYEICQGASPSKEKRHEMDPKDIASGNSYRRCIGGLAHSVSLLSNKTESGLEVVKKEMYRCANQIASLKLGD